MLGYPRPDGKLILDTSASSHAVDAVLSQEQDRVERVLAYFSQTLKCAERQYCVSIIVHNSPIVTINYGTLSRILQVRPPLGHYSFLLIERSLFLLILIVTQNSGS